MAGATYKLFGDRDIRLVSVLSATVIRIGDLCYLDASDKTVKPADLFPWDTDLATTRAAFSLRFLGAATSASANGETSPVSVDMGPEGVYEIGCELARFAIGDMLTPAQDGEDENLSRVAVQKTTTSAAAIARVHAAATINTPVITCHFASAFVLGSGNRASEVGA